MMQKTTTYVAGKCTYTVDIQTHADYTSNVAVTLKVGRRVFEVKYTCDDYGRPTNPDERYFTKFLDTKTAPVNVSNILGNGFSLIEDADIRKILYYFSAGLDTKMLRKVRSK